MEHYLQINFFDLKKQTLNISAFENNKVNANIKLKWEKVSEYLNLKRQTNIQLKDISKSFDGRPILKKLSMKVFPGNV